MSQSTQMVADTVDGSSTPAGKWQVEQKRTRLTITVRDDIHILQEVISNNPFEDNEKWNTVASNLITLVPKGLTVRNIQERVDLLVKQYIAETNVFKRNSAEEQLRDQFLQDVKYLRDSHAAAPTTRSKSSMKAAREDRLAMRDGAAATFASPSQSSGNPLLDNHGPNDEQEIMNPDETQEPVEIGRPDSSMAPSQSPPVPSAHPTRTSSSSSSSSPSPSFLVGGPIRKPQHKAQVQVDHYQKGETEIELIKAKSELCELENERTRLRLEERKFELEVKKFEFQQEKERKRLELEEKKFESIERTQSRLIALVEDLAKQVSHRGQPL